MSRPMPRWIVAALLVELAAAACRSTTREPAPSGTRPVAGTPTVLVPAAQSRADGGRLAYTVADVAFMTGMISHHAQAVLMAGWAPTHGAGSSVRVLCERIVVAQRDEILVMQHWLRDHHEPVPDPDPRGQMMPGMDQPMLMPGMLNPQELAELDSARGPEFDRLFLTFMIMHHQGAITMVDQLLASQGAAQDNIVFLFAADVNADQSTEIDRMSRMLAALPTGGRQ